MIDADDDVFFQAAPIHIRAVMSELRRLEKPCKRVILAGGGNIGMRLARATKERYRVKVIERDLGRSKRIAEDLERTIVLHGDAADEELLLEENIESTDVFCAVTNAAFESISGLTTTGATVILGVDNLPKSILFDRQQLRWLRGMGIIVLAVAVLPMLGVGGMQLYRAEKPGPMKDTKLTARITETAKALWHIYLWLTVACALAHWGAGMTLFDAVCHALATVAISGFSTHDLSMGYFDCTTIEMIAVVF